MTKQLFIVYDDKHEDCATLLYSLLGQHPNIKSSLYTKKEINKLVSREKCLYIGENCSSKLSFDDCYNELGIHIGYMGSKAWIRCFKYYGWNVDRFKEFERKLKLYTDKYNLKNVYERYEYVDKVLINTDFQHGIEPWPGNAITRLWDKNIKNSGSSRIWDISGAILNQLALGGLINRLTMVPTIRTYQYYIGVLKFYDEYLDDFLELSDSNKESNDEDTITESEKKN